ncbi:hypothetical protein GPECTOR_17g919 [Gonium pectorale]|uniref:Uncharacterized protein n=1 Tax=Gonium pectorale TaxID=33097 RepID=A0A150GLT9_GONPE|nr:hypothetical protein GPECTOR_17g919 [Gonium pectorale]|eukprot:KXZ50280.1 hypothetical protein GPECTOR_17g919 [Gonium pectorale]
MSTRYVDALFRAVSSSSGRLDLQNVLATLTTQTLTQAAVPLDHFYARIGAINGPFFPAGWGNLGVVKYEEDLLHLTQTDPSSIKLSWRLVERGARDGTEYVLYEGTFRTPCLQRVYDALPPESRTGRVQLLMPSSLRDFEPLQQRDDAAKSGSLRGQGASAQGGVDGPGAVVHLAATGDQTFGRRLRLGAPLLKDRGSKLLRVSDLLTLGWATIAESISLLHWLREQGFGPLGMCGLSMGGVHASMTAGLYPGDVAVTPLLAPRSAAVAYCDGAMRAVMAWEPLLKEVDENNNRITQVVMSAGRAVTLELPGARESVALMREATYALADLEAAGEKRHMAEAAAGGGGGSSGAGATGAAASAAGEASSCASAPAKVAAGVAGGATGVLRSLPNLSIMDVYGALAETALRVAGLRRAEERGKQAQQGQERLGRRAPGAGAKGAVAADGEAGVPFSGIPAAHGDAGLEQQQQQQRGSCQSTTGRDPRVGRSHPPPHGPDTPFPPQRPVPHGHAASASPVADPAGSPDGGGREADAGAGSVMGRRLLGDLGRAVKQLRAGDRRMDNPDTVMRLKRVLETYTDITRYPRPRRADAAVIVAARDDAYVSGESVRQLHEYWPGSELRMVSGGHVSAFLMHQDAFRQAIRDSLTRVARPPPPR